MTAYFKEFPSSHESPILQLTPEEMFSVYYHNFFDYPLNFSEIVRWKAGEISNSYLEIDYNNGFYFIKGREGLIYKRALRERISQKKYLIAQKASKLISGIPAVKMIGVTGSLAMGNATKESDIDLMIITKKGKLWTTRIAVYILLKISGFSVRRPGETNQKNKLCLNIWLDESDMAWPIKARNVYTAHEILQTIPIVNKGKSYERFLFRNKWALRYWPNAQKIKVTKKSSKYTKLRNLNLINKLAYNLQYLYLKPKLTREEVGITKAIFHPRDLSKETLKKIYLTQK